VALLDLCHVSWTESPWRQLFHRTQTNPIGLTQRPIDRPGFGHAHFGIVENQRGDVAGMSIAKADKAFTLGRLEYRRFEYPEAFCRAGQFKHRLGVNCVAAVGEGDPQ
jgi:hypothetical protein